MTAADELASAGRYLEAVDLLMTTVPAPASADVETKLLGFRHAAFVHQGKSAQAPEVWPRRFADPFPGSHAVPVVSEPDFSVDVLGGAIQHHGCLLVRGLLDAPTVARLLEDVDAAFEQRGAWRRNLERWDAELRDDPGDAGNDADGTPRVHGLGSDRLDNLRLDQLPGTGLWDSPWFRPFVPTSELTISHSVKPHFANPARVMVADSPRTAFDLISAFDHSRIRDVVSGYFGERPAFSVMKSAVTRQRFNMYGVGWHQEAVVFRQPVIRTVNVWLALSQCGEDAPGLCVLPRRLESAVEVGPDEHPLKLSDAAVERVANGATPTPLSFEPGDALLFDEMLLHKTMLVSGMNRDRVNVEFWMFSPSYAPERLGPMML